MKRLLCIAMLGIAGAMAGGAAAADDLADAERLLAARSFDAALPLYRRLAEAGNPDAQMRLGEGKGRLSTSPSPVMIVRLLTVITVDEKDPGLSVLPRGRDRERR